MCVFSIYDKVAKVYFTPYFIVNSGCAKRSLSEALRSAQSSPSGSQMSSLIQHPDDYDLYQLATFDCVSGSFVSLSQPDLVITVRDLVDIMSSSNSSV